MVCTLEVSSFKAFETQPSCSIIDLPLLTKTNLEELHISDEPTPTQIRVGKRDVRKSDLQLLASTAYIYGIYTLPLLPSRSLSDNATNLNLTSPLTSGNMAYIAYTFPSPAEGYENAAPLPDEVSEDGKSLKNPETGVLSKAYETFIDPLEKGRRGGL